MARLSDVEAKLRLEVDTKGIEEATGPASELVNELCNAALDAAADAEMPIDRVNVDCGFATVTFAMGRTRV